ncbi:hypothetical protein PCE1_003624 [Barthelona sp. PCE]
MFNKTGEFGDFQVLVTVGTTKFDDLVELFLDSRPDNLIQYFERQNVRLIVQYGRSELEIPENDVFQQFIPNFTECIGRSNIVITAGGAGTITECLERNVYTIAIPNETLMGNHQLELTEPLYEKGLIQTFRLTECSRDDAINKIKRLYEEYQKPCFSHENDELKQQLREEFDSFFNSKPKKE